MKVTAESELHPQPRKPLAEKIWKIICEKHDFAPLSEESLKNLALANQTLKTESIVVYANHTSKSDAEVAVALVLSHLTNAKRYMAPAGMKHYDLRRDFKSGVLLRALKILNIHIIPVVQHDDLDAYPERKRKGMLAKLKQRATSLLTKPQGIYGITPEGTRSKETLQLLRARPGVGKIEKYAPADIQYVPVGILYKNQAEKPEVIVGKPESIAEIQQRLGVQISDSEETRAQEIADILMYKLSLLLPQHIRGYYK